MRHYLLFALKTLGVILGSILIITVVAQAVLWVGNYRHHDYSTGSKASGEVAGIANFHDHLVKMVNTGVDGDTEAYKESLTYGGNEYTLFNRNHACPLGSGKISTFGILVSQKYSGYELMMKMVKILNASGYEFTHATHAGDKAGSWVTTFKVNYKDYVSTIYVTEHFGDKSDALLDNFMEVSTQRTDGKTLCYPLADIPKPKVANLPIP